MRLTWLNNVQAPYREPMLCELAELTDFRACYFHRSEPKRHFHWRAHPGYRSEVVGSWTPRVPERIAARLGEPVGVLRPGTVSGILDRVDAMITQVWWQPANVQAMLACRRRGIPYLLYAESTMHDRSVSGGPADRLRSWVFSGAGAVLVPGPAAAEAAVANGTPRHRIVETVNSVDVDRYRGAMARMRAGRSAAGPHRFAVVGQLVPRKNVDGMLRAFATLDGSPTLEIAGDGAQQEHLRALAAELGIDDRVTFLGFLDEDGVLDLLARSHTLGLPSTEEVYGYTALEAHVCGLQVVVADVAGIARTIAGKPGVQVTGTDDAALAAALRRAQASFAGWPETVDTSFASPRRAAADIVAAVDVARGLDPGRPTGAGSRVTMPRGSTRAPWSPPGSAGSPSDLPRPRSSDAGPASAGAAAR